MWIRKTLCEPSLNKKVLQSPDNLVPKNNDSVHNQWYLTHSYTGFLVAVWSEASMFGEEMAR